jgi:ABC-type antimicrobial peptide transport system permease subunit
MVALVGFLMLLVLAVARGNLGGLLLARGEARRREMAVRSAIGAGPGRLVRQLFTESLMLALLGCLGGLVLGAFVIKGILVWTQAPGWLDPVGSARSLAMSDPEAVELYRLAREADFTSLSLVVRTAGPPADRLTAVTTTANDIDRNFKPQVHLLQDRFDENVGDIQSGAIAAGVLALIALTVACVGVVGLVAYSVAANTKEIGIRLALGARAHDILATLSRQFRAPVVGGLVAGMMIAAGLVQLLRRELYGISTLDPLAYLAAIAVFLVAVGLAAGWPASRALRVDPLSALRGD